MVEAAVAAADAALEAEGASLAAREHGERGQRPVRLHQSARHRQLLGNDNKNHS
jgi:hypothetical protein